MTYDGDAFTDLFAETAEVSLDPFATPLAGHNALRAYLNDAAERERYFDLAIERHWVVGRHGRSRHGTRAGTGSSDDAKIRQAGFLSAEVGEDGRIARLRMWAVTREHLAGQEGA